MSCFECDAPDAQHNHHVVPRSLGGTRTVPLCEECHSKIHGVSMNASALSKMALRRRRDSGYRTGTVPFGYGVDAQKKLFRVNREQEIILRIRSMRATGVSLSAITRQLAKAGVIGREALPLSLSQVTRIARIDPNDRLSAIRNSRTVADSTVPAAPVPLTKNDVRRIRWLLSF